MNRKKLITANIVLGIGGVLAMFYIFGITMLPNSRAELRYQKKVWVGDLEIGDYKSGELGNTPINIERKTETEFSVLSMVGKYGERKWGYLVRIIDNDPEVRFREVGHYAIYNSRGEVLEGSSPTAQNLERLDFEYKNSFIYAY